MTPFPDRAAKARQGHSAQTGSAMTYKQHLNDTHLMLQEALRALPLTETLDAITAHIEAHPDVDPAALDAFGNKMSRHADKIEREARK